MKVVLCINYGLPDTLVLLDTATPSIKDDEVLIAVKACGVNFPDTLIIQNKYQFKPPLPFAPGGEVSGIVIATGAGVTHIKTGDRVLALCGWGGFAEEVAVDSKRVFPIPPDMDFITAASTLYNYGTSYHALKDRAGLKAGETLLVMGAAGGVGIAAVELGKLMGATVIAAASSNDKLMLCKEKGAEYLINYSTEDLRSRIKEITGDKGVDIIYDPVGGKLAEQALRSIAWKGRYLIVGFASGEIPQLPFNLALLRGCSVMGVFWGSFAEKEPKQSLQNLGELLQWLRAGKIKQPIYKIYRLEEAAKAVEDIMNRKVIGKAIVKVGDWNEDASQSTITNEKNINTETKQTGSSKPLLINGLADITNHVGKSVGPSEWLMVTQEMINNFASATLDFQWVHVDVEKAKAVLPGGKTIAHGYLSMSLVSQFFYQLITIENVNSFYNYGINKARFITPVTVGSRIRLQANFTGAEKQPNGSVKIFLTCIIELEDADKPAYVADLISLVV